jgi:hypothetical protein
MLQRMIHDHFWNELRVGRCPSAVLSCKIVNKNKNYEFFVCLA